MATTQTSRRSYREWFEKCEFNRELTTENLARARNTRDITLGANGRYIAGIMLTFVSDLAASAAETAIAGVTALDYFVDDITIKVPTGLQDYKFISPAIVHHAHRVFLDEGILEVIPLFGGMGVDTLTSRVIIPCTLDKAAGEYSMIIDSNLTITDIYAADVVGAGDRVTINTISTDTPPPVQFFIRSQTALLPAAGQGPIATLTQGYFRESISMMGPSMTSAGASAIDTIEYILPTGRGVIKADHEQLLFQWLKKFDLADATWLENPAGPSFLDITDELLIDLSYLTNGVPTAWNDGGQFSIETNGATGVVVTPDIMEVLLYSPLYQQQVVQAPPTNLMPTPAQGPGTSSGMGGGGASGKERPGGANTKTMKRF